MSKPAYEKHDACCIGEKETLLKLSQNFPQLRYLNISSYNEIALYLPDFPLLEYLNTENDLILNSLGRSLN